MTQGFPSACGMKRNDLFKEHRFGAGDIFDGLARHRIGHEADEIAGMARLHGNADFAVSLEAADARAMPGTRIHHHEWPAHRIDLDAFRRNDAHQQVIDRPLQRPAVHHQLGLIVEDMRDFLGEMVAILVAALAHHIAEQHAALRRIYHVFEGGPKRPKGVLPDTC